MFNPLVTILSVSTLLVGSSNLSAQASRSTLDPDLKELASYTLTVDTLNRVDRATRAMIASVQKDPKYAERIKLGKELDALKKKEETSEAEDKRMEELSARIEELEAAEDKDDSPTNTLSDMERKINAMPALASALKQEGVTAREFARFSMAMIQAGFAVAAQQMADKMGQPFKVPEGVNPANIAFVKEHEAEIKRMQQAYEQSGIK